MDKKNKSHETDQKIQYPTMTSSELEKSIGENTDLKAKRRILLSQIGYLRVNIFNDDFEQIQKAEKAGDLDKAVQIMEAYAEEIAIPFVPINSKPGIAQRIANFLDRKRMLDLNQFIQQWRNEYSAWILQENGGRVSVNKKARIDQYEKVKVAFIKVYTYSFSPENFPPLTNMRTDR